MKEAADHICPRCGGPVPQPGHQGEWTGATSRSDNETEICALCGVDEALFSWARHSSEVVQATNPRSEWFDRTGIRKTHSYIAKEATRGTRS